MRRSKIGINWTAIPSPKIAQASAKNLRDRRHEHGHYRAVQISRGLSHPNVRGNSFTATDRTRPITKNSRRLESGANQTKCRLAK